jgi:hypothetical protein
MKEIKNMESFLKTGRKDQSSFFEAQINYDDVDYHGKITSIKKDIEREQKKFRLFTKVDQLNDILRSLNDVIQDLDEINVNTKGLQDTYYKLATNIKSLT